MSSKPVLLYIDDEEANQFVFGFNFQDDFEVITASSGDEGLSLMKKNKNIAAVVSDFLMPGMNGLEFISKAKSAHRNAVYFILTGYGINEQIQKAISKGELEGYFNKPFDIDEMKNSINSAFSRKK